MKFNVIITPEGIRTHEVVERAEGENCQVIRQFDVGQFVEDVRTGPDCDESHERQF